MIRAALAHAGCALVCAAGIRAQHALLDAPVPQRKALIGRVVDDQGRPCAGARVTLHGVQPFWIEQNGDTVVAIADERGRFAAKVLPSVPYCGFAEALPDASGGAGASRMHGWFGAGAQVALVCSAPVARSSLQIQGNEAWSQLGPLAWSLALADTERICGAALPLTPDADGRAPLPTLFAARAASPSARTALCEVRTAQGELLWSRLCAPAPDLLLTLPPPRVLPFAVLDPQHQPLAGAHIAVRQGFRGDGGIDGLETVRGQVWRELGVTGADGHLSAAVPLELDPFTSVVGEAWVFRARRDGCAESMSGFLGNQDLCDDQRVARGEQREVRFALRAEPTRTLRILRGEAPAVGAHVRIDLIAKLGVSGAGFTHDPRTFEAVVGADGQAAFPFVPVDVHGMRVQILEQGAAMPVVCAPDAVQFGQTLNLADCVRVRLRVRDARDGPCAGACGYLRWAKETTSGLGADLRFVADTAGAASLRLLPAGEWELALGSVEAGMACELLDLTEPDTEREVRLEPFAVGRGTVLAAGDQPVVGASIRKWEFAGDVLPKSRLHAAFVRHMQARLCLSAMTGADGTFVLPVVPLHRPSLRLSYGLGARTSEVTELAPDLGPITLRMR